MIGYRFSYSVSLGYWRGRVTGNMAKKSFWMALVGAQCSNLKRGQEASGDVG